MDLLFWFVILFSCCDAVLFLLVVFFVVVSVVFCCLWRLFLLFACCFLIGVFYYTISGAFFVVSLCTVGDVHEDYRNNSKENKNKTEACCDNMKINNKIVALDGIYLNLITYATGCNTSE
jgi:hypothetical protein